MSSEASIRWPRGAEWGYLCVRTATGETRFGGFIRMDDQRLLAALSNAGVRDLDHSGWQVDEGEDPMCEIRFPLDDRAPVLL